MESTEFEKMDNSLLPSPQLKLPAAKVSSLSARKHFLRGQKLHCSLRAPFTQKAIVSLNREPVGNWLFLSRDTYDLSTPGHRTYQLAMLCDAFCIKRVPPSFLGSVPRQNGAKSIKLAFPSKSPLHQPSVTQRNRNQNA